MWYRKNNPTRPGWKKDVIPPYVSSLVCLKKFKPPNSSVIRTPKTKVSSRAIKNRKFFAHIREYFSSFYNSRRNNNRLHNNSSSIFTISDNTLARDKIHITKKNLVSTTNPEAINCSSNINVRNSLLVNNLSKDNENIAENSGINFVNPKLNMDSPKKIEFGTIISDRIKNLQKSSKNFHGLKLKTDMAFEHLNESPCGSSTPNLCDNTTIKMNVSQNISQLSDGFKKLNEINKLPSVNSEIMTFHKSQEPTPFYDKKPPPPPAPPQHLKPKI